MSQDRTEVRQEEGAWRGGNKASEKKRAMEKARWCVCVCEDPRVAGLGSCRHLLATSLSRKAHGCKIWFC